MGRVPELCGNAIGVRLVRFTRVLLLCTSHFTHWKMGSNHHALLRSQQRTSRAIIRLCQEGQGETLIGTEGSEEYEAKKVDDSAKEKALDVDNGSEVDA